MKNKILFFICIKEKNIITKSELILKTKSEPKLNLNNLIQKRRNIQKITS